METYYVDIPDKDTIGDQEHGWTNLAEDLTKEQAIEFIRENIGWCDDEGNICLLTLKSTGKES